MFVGTWERLGNGGWLAAVARGAAMAHQSQGQVSALRTSDACMEDKRRRRNAFKHEVRSGASEQGRPLPTPPVSPPVPPPKRAEPATCRSNLRARHGGHGGSCGGERRCSRSPSG
jgi:hypothetical protein